MTKFELALNFIQATEIQPQPDGKGNCIQASLTFRDFLRGIGIAADVKSVILGVQAMQDGQELYSLGIGPHIKAQIEATGGWDGHLVVTTNNILIDTTFSHIRRPAWNWTPDMVVIPLIPRPERISMGDLSMPGFSESNKRLVIAALLKENDAGYHFRALWAAHPGNSGWEQSNSAKPDRRQKLVKFLIEKFNKYRRGK